MSTPLTLCEGLEIIAANDAPHLFAAGKFDLPGLMVNHIIREQDRLSDLFMEPKWLEFTHTADGEVMALSALARPWPPAPKFWLLEWRDHTELSLLQHELWDAKNHDAKTGALLSGAFARSVSQQVSHINGAVLALLAFDHTSARQLDDVLLSMTERLEHEFMERLLVARHDTSSLCLFVEAEVDERAALHIMRQLNRLALACTDGEKAHVAVAQYPADGSNHADLMEAAHLALEAARKTGNPCLFEQKLREDKSRRKQLAADLPGAIASNEITPHFQPVIDATTGQIKGFEALIRWFHPTLGYVIPPEIVDIAQSMDELDHLTAHVMEQTISQMQKWPAPVQFAVNVTPSQLKGELVDMVRGFVRNTRIDPSRLEIEVTEDALIEDFDCSATIFARLRAIGVSVAMDDFGVGYTSVGNLRKLDFTKIKIDKVISDGLPHDRKSVAIVKSLMFMARELGVDITVEGIETEEQLAFLRAFRCGVQGYVFSKPLPADQLPSMRKHLTPQHQQDCDNKVVGIGPNAGTTSKTAVQG